MSPWSEIATVANLIASLSIFSGILVYKIEKSDTDVFTVQRAIIAFRSAVESLNLNFRTELFSEMASYTVYAESMKPIIPQVFKVFKEKIAEYQAIEPKKQEEFIKAASEELIKLIDGIPTGLSTPLVIRTEDKIEFLLRDSMPFTPQYAGLERISSTVYHFFLQLLNKYRTICLDLDNWKTVFRSMIENEIEVQDEELFKNAVCNYLVALQNTIGFQHDQDDIDNIIKITNLTCNAYLSKSTRELKKLRKSKIALQPFDTFDTYVDQFSEAQKALRSVFSRDEENEYSNIVKEFEIHNK
ncbi:hypothetical protein [Caproiciproducens faecalis]|uniref:Uncharacterized protein n=1 Tax=Caproiciproducens faecalis TaxID=2820301 RepID=A0ABS7DQ18_9FIRM|nr:hypothetical protein [Caproiciproducens faecalis]MBW7573409.1 hypothetical protein [Caproiciproducens faecalis]